MNQPFGKSWSSWRIIDIAKGNFGSIKDIINGTRKKKGRVYDSKRKAGKNKDEDEHEFLLILTLSAAANSFNILLRYVIKIIIVRDYIYCYWGFLIYVISILCFILYIITIAMHVDHNKWQFTKVRSWTKTNAKTDKFVKTVQMRLW